MTRQYNTIGERVVYSLMDLPVHTATDHGGGKTLDLFPDWVSGYADLLGLLRFCEVLAR